MSFSFDLIWLACAWGSHFWFNTLSAACGVMRNAEAKRFWLIGVEARLCEAERDRTARRLVSPRPSCVTSNSVREEQKCCRGHGTPSHVHLRENDISCLFKFNLAVHISLRYQARPSLLTKQPGWIKSHRRHTWKYYRTDTFSILSSLAKTCLSQSNALIYT